MCRVNIPRFFSLLLISTFPWYQSAGPARGGSAQICPSKLLRNHPQGRCGCYSLLVRPHQGAGSSRFGRSRDMLCCLGPGLGHCRPGRPPSNDMGPSGVEETRQGRFFISPSSKDSVALRGTATGRRPLPSLGAAEGASPTQPSDPPRLWGRPAVGHQCNLERGRHRPSARPCYRRGKG